ncbi:hypothetical protein PVAND_017199 [Polypedilum vanderplanki]|uniref:Chitin-binding type-2 domain-containing protein n=1 Tax=Polypedilum vanderplanki TaxID=319348 RepID=A0A9J6BIC1_POLVA|nr:hypothetical protein PVAND_017199 [Polypedilum vanderplanki]
MNLFIIFLITFSALKVKAKTPEILITDKLDVNAFCQFVEDGQYCNSLPGCFDAFDGISNAARFQCVNNEPVYIANTTELDLLPCPNSKPYCFNGICVKNKVACKVPEFTCPGIGIFPDPKDCQKYYTCSFDPALNQIVAIQKSCDDGYNFNPYESGDIPCVLGNGNTCKTAKCRGNKTELRPLNYNDGTKDQYAAFCINGQFQNLWVCPAGLSIDLSQLNRKTCYVNCKKDNQKAVYEEDDRKFYICLNGEAILATCPDGKIFDADTLNCISY